MKLLCKYRSYELIHTLVDHPYVSPLKPNE